MRSGGDRHPTDLDGLLQPRPGFTVRFSARQVAASLWDYDEDDLATRALQMSNAELTAIQTVAAWFDQPDYPLPVSGQRITNSHVIALAAITFYEGSVRPLRRERRRPAKNRPRAFDPS